MPGKDGRFVIADAGWGIRPVHAPVRPVPCFGRSLIFRRARWSSPPRRRRAPPGQPFAPTVATFLRITDVDAGAA